MEMNSLYISYNYTFIKDKSLKTEIFHKIKFDLKGDERSHKALLAIFFSSSFIYQQILMKISLNTNILKS